MTGGHWVPCNIGSVEAHNERRPEYLEAVKKTGLNLYFFQELTNNNSHWVNNNERYCNKTVAEVFDAMKSLYKKKMGQVPQLKEKIKVDKKTGKEYKCAGWSPIREMCVPIKGSTSIKDFDYLKNWAEKYGIEIMRIDLHKDEGHRDKSGEYKMNYHAHVVASFLNWDTAKTVKPNSEAMSEMQTVLANALGMKRGERKADTGRKHLDHIEYRKMMEAIDKEKEKLDCIVAQQSKEYKKLQSLTTEVKQAETRLKGLTTMLKNLEAQKDNLEAQIAFLEDEFADNSEQMEQKREELIAKLTEIEEKITDKMQKREEAELKLQELAKQKNSLQVRYDNLMRKAVKVEPDVFEKTQKEVNATMWDEAARELKNDYSALQNFAQRLPPNTRMELNNILEGSFFEDAAQRGEEITGVAAALFLGYIDQATTFAHGSGGGGSPGNGWGREKDEDDEAYRRRCCIMGRMMMKPAGRKQNIRRSR